MTEREKNAIVMKELFGDKPYDPDILNNRFIDWDKAYSSIFYIQKSEEMESRGENVYKEIRKKCQDYLSWFSDEIKKSDCFNV